MSIVLIYVQLTFPTADRSLAVPSWETVSLVQNANISQADREMSSALRFKLWVLVSPPARALGTLRAVSGIRASRPFAAIKNPGPPEACIVWIISTGGRDRGGWACGGGCGACSGTSGPSEPPPGPSESLDRGAGETRAGESTFSGSESSESNKPDV